nr:MAG TPA: hypothetical protein [Caudoviricetes sp.]
MRKRTVYSLEYQIIIILKYLYTIISPPLILRPLGIFLSYQKFKKFKKSCV